MIVDRGLGFGVDAAASGIVGLRTKELTPRSWAPASDVESLFGGSFVRRDPTANPGTLSPPSPAMAAQSFAIASEYETTSTRPKYLPTPPASENQGKSPIIISS